MFSSFGYPNTFSIVTFVGNKKKSDLLLAVHLSILHADSGETALLVMNSQSCGERSALKLVLKRKIRLFVSGSTVDMLLIPFSLIFKLLAWKPASECFQLWRRPCINSSEKLPLLGRQVQRPAKSSAASFWISSHTMTGGHQTKRSSSF